ncbi:hypothetical protein GTQ40_04785 [Flavobacteriaceae bacterium R38]|nr:hypothetical protein [Flavobacteriaceae bacterium R38]
MELLELKSIWKKAIKQQVDTPNLTAEEVHMLINKKSNTAISKIKREMKFKIWFMGILGVLGMVMSVILLFVGKEEHLLESIFNSVEISVIYFLMSVVIFIFSRRIKTTRDKIREYQRTSLDLKTAIEDVLVLMKKIIKLAVTIAGIMTPFFVVWITYTYLYEERVFVFDIRVLYLLIILIVSHKLFSFLETRVQRKKYGKYIDTLKQCLDELEEVEKM